MKKTLFILCLFTVISVQAQDKFTISGTIKDATNGETLIGATVQIKDTGNGTTTNEYGYYSMTANAGPNTVVISYLGYNDKEISITLDKNIKLNDELEEVSEQLEEIIVLAENPDIVNIETPQMSVNKLSTKQIKHIPAVLGEVDIIKSIQLLPGVSNSGEGASGFNVRGGAEDQNLVLLDEAVIYNSSHLFGFFSVFNADAIKDVKLYKGGIPAKFGGRASSVLDIRQRDGNSKKLRATGGLGLISSRLTLEGPTFKDKGSFIVAGRSSYLNIFLAAAKNENRAGFYDLNLKTNYDINANNRIYLSGYFGQDNFDLGGFFKNTYGNLSGNLRWNHIFSDKLFSNLSMIYSKYNYALDFNVLKFDWISDIENFNLKYDFAYFINEKIILKYGASTIYYKFNPGKLSPTSADSEIRSDQLDKKTAFESGVYVSLKQKVTPRLTAQYGLRYSLFNRIGKQSLTQYENHLPVIYNAALDIYEPARPNGAREYKSGENIKTFGNLEPRLALSYKLNQNASLKASYNRMAQYLHLISNTASATPLDVWAPSGDYIEPQIADQFALGYFRNFENNTYALEIESYYKVIKGRVDYIDGAELVAQRNIESQILQGESRAYGLELLVRKNKGTLTGWLAYTLSKSEQRSKGGDIGGLGINSGNWYNTSYDRTHDISVTANYKLSNQWSFGANIAFQTGRPVTYPNGQFEYNNQSVATYSDRNADRLPAYHRIDISATWSPKKNLRRKWYAEWVFGVYNIYNRKNAASIGFGQNIETGANEATRTAIFGIIPSITYNFKF